MGQTYFKTRNFDEDFNKTGEVFPMHRVKIERGNPDQDKAKRSKSNAEKSHGRKASSQLGNQE